LPSYDDHLAYAIALNVEHFMKVKSVVLTINGLEVYRHQVPYALKLAKSNEGFFPKRCIHNGQRKFCTGKD